MSLAALPSLPVVPNAAVQRVGGETGVWQLVDGDLRFTPVTLGVADLGGQVQVRAGLNVGDRIVVINFAYTTCTTVCPVSSASLAQVQGQLGDRIGRDVGLVTVTVDPLRDTLARLKAYAGSVGAGAGWTWLTGPKPQVLTVNDGDDLQQLAKRAVYADFRVGDNHDH